MRNVQALILGLVVFGACSLLGMAGVGAMAPTPPLAAKSSSEALAAPGRHLQASAIHLQEALYAPESASRAAAARELHVMVTNRWIAPAPRAISEARLADLGSELWPPWKTDVKMSAVQNDGSQGGPLESPLVVVAEYLAALCGVPVSETLVRQTQFSVELAVVTDLVLTRSLPARQALESPMFLADAFESDADTCRKLPRG